MRLSIVALRGGVTQPDINIQSVVMSEVTAGRIIGILESPSFWADREGTAVYEAGIVELRI